MRRNLTAKRTAHFTDEPANPMDGIANLADVMLVLAVGIMLALVINWNVDLSLVSAANLHESADTRDAPEFTETDLSPATGGDAVDESAMRRLGTVYYDEATGTYYIIESETTKAEVSNATN